MGLLATEEFLSAIVGHVLARMPQHRKPRTGTIDYGHTGPGPARVQFDGEPAPTSNRFPRLSSYRPRAGDRVLLVPSGARGWWVVGSADLVESDDQLLIKEEHQDLVFHHAGQRSRAVCEHGDPCDLPDHPGVARDRPRRW
ncbi:hypothetical protein [Nocardiopsis metallicus]|uniref:Uncharacterized protein n=1 Tax=Nocardiopsis metallicus TaxID=179819 RepID=A0A840WER2_9ACTN|nr:hypothetical protein [Nocardiopsis metallicus]MBB5491501.1 hypothetical protein [Nocardiopsis metallicus]